MKVKKALLVVSFGTSHKDTLIKNITAIETAISDKFPDAQLYRAFTSGMIIKILCQRDGMEILNTAEALSRLENEGCAQLTIQPTHIMNGDEFEKMLSQARPFAERMPVSIGRPLLTTVSDYRDVASALMSRLDAPAGDEAIVFMGHGTGHYANAAYSQLDYMLRDLGWPRAFIGTVEGYPELDEVMRRLKEHPEIKRIRLYPLMIVAGDHAKNDMAGDQPDSWKCRLEAQGYEVRCYLTGLGEFEAIRSIFASHALEAKPFQA